jgi:ABC-type uncharacterized transport system substrate-binding protein
MQSCVADRAWFSEPSASLTTWKIVKGAKPADPPIEQPVKFELVVNLKTVRRIGLALDRSFLLRADDLIE